MKISLVMSLLLLAFASVWRGDGLGPSVGMKDGYAARIPEHTCHKLIDSNTCELQKCMDECSKEPAGVGQCRDYNVCRCTYYCKDPSM